MSQPLAGIKIADFTHVMAGPFASHLLRLLGAEVIKIETPGRGDAMRYYGTDRQYDGMAPAFIAVNCGKKSITLDLKDPDELEIARDIVDRCDVMIENFRPGVIGRLGLGHEEMRARNPRLIYCSVSGYGQSGPLRDWPAIDNIVQATSGMMSLGGNPGDPPMRVGFPVVDTLTGQTAGFAILAALFRREREGRGEFIDVAMLDATLGFMASAVGPFLVTGTALSRTGNVGYSGQPTAALFETQDGRMISLGVVQQSQFEALARFVGREVWLSDQRFSDPDLRRQNSDAMQAELSAVLKTRDGEVWEREMSAHGIPCGLVRSVAEGAAFPHLAERNAILPIEIAGLPGGNACEIVNAGFKFAEDGPTVSEPPPRLGEHRLEILDWVRNSQPNSAS